MATMTTPQEIAAAIEQALDVGGHLVIRFGHGQMRQLKIEEVDLVVATLKAASPTPQSQPDCDHLWMTPGIGATQCAKCGKFSAGSHAARSE